MFRLLPPFVANQYIVGPPLWPPWNSFLRATEMLPPRLGVLNIPTKENSSLLLGCDYIF